MEYLSSKPFSVGPSAPVDPRRDCSTVGHWPVKHRDGYTCWFCQKACTRTGEDVEVSK